MSKYSKILFPVLMLLFSSFALTACETVEGAGRDIESAGSAIQDASEEAAD